MFIFVQKHPTEMGLLANEIQDIKDSLASYTDSVVQSVGILLIAYHCTHVLYAQRDVSVRQKGIPWPSHMAKDHFDITNISDTSPMNTNYLLLL